MSAVERFVACAVAQIGKPYQLGSRGPNAFDCSNLVAYCYREATGQDITGDSHAQFQLGTPVKNGLQPGDLLFYSTGFSQRLGNTASHVGIFIGNNRMINALNEDYGVVESSTNSQYWTSRYLGARRLFTERASGATVQAPTEKPEAVAGPPAGEGGFDSRPSPPKPTRDRDRQKRREQDRQRRGGRKGRR